MRGIDARVEAALAGSVRHAFVNRTFASRSSCCPPSPSVHIARGCCSRRRPPSHTPSRTSSPRVGDPAAPPQAGRGHRAPRTPRDCDSDRTRVAADHVIDLELRCRLGCEPRHQVASVHAATIARDAEVALRLVGEPRDIEARRVLPPIFDRRRREQRSGCRQRDDRWRWRFGLATRDREQHHRHEPSRHASSGLSACGGTSSTGPCAGGGGSPP